MRLSRKRETQAEPEYELANASPASSNRGSLDWPCVFPDDVRSNRQSRRRRCRKNSHAIGQSLLQELLFEQRLLKSDGFIPFRPVKHVSFHAVHGDPMIAKGGKPAGKAALQLLCRCVKEMKTHHVAAQLARLAGDRGPIKRTVPLENLICAAARLRIGRDQRIPEQRPRSSSPRIRPRSPQG